MCRYTGSPRNAFFCTYSVISCLPLAVTRIQPFECSGFEPMWMRMPLRPGTPFTNGSGIPNLGDIVTVSLYVPSGKMKSSFSMQYNTMASCPTEMVIVPVTALPDLCVRVSVRVVIIFFELFCECNAFLSMVDTSNCFFLLVIFSPNTPHSRFYTYRNSWVSEFV